MLTYYAEIPGNYVTKWLNDFQKAVDDNKYKRIDYKTWRELKNLSATNKVKLVIEKADNFTTKIKQISFLYPITTDKAYLTLTRESQFTLFFEDDVMNSNIDIEWHTKTTIDDITYTEDGYYINQKGVSTYVPYATAAGTSSVYNTITSSDYSDFCSNYDYKNLTEIVDEIAKDLDEIKKEKTNNMASNVNTNNIFNFDFGPVTDSNIRLSMYGYAIPNEVGKFVSYDKENERMMDVQILNFDCAGIFYKVPKPLNKVEEGDVIFHNNVPVFITDIVDETRIIVIDPKDGTEKTILPAHSPFGFDYVSTLISLVDGFNIDPDKDNPFGSMLPLIMLSNSKSQDISLPLMMALNGKMDFDNPMMLLALTGNNNFDTSNPLLMMMLMKSFDK